VKTDGSLWAFGLNHAGQLGDGTKENHATPVKVMDGVKAATAGLHHSLALKTDGTLWTFGRNDFGQLGVYERPDRPVPAQVLTDVTAIATGGNDSWAIRADGSLWGFGGGVGPTPRRFAEGVIAVASAAGHTLVVKADRSVWGFGENGAGELGKRTRSNYSRELIRVMDNGELVAAGNGSSLVLKTDGTLWGFGANNWGQLGKGDTRKGPVEIMVSAGPAATLVTFGVCIDSRVRVRSEAGLWAATLGYLENGDPVEILEKSPMKMWVESVEDYWYRIRRLTDGLTGWSFGKYLKMKTEEWRAPEPP
jgi:alpha-tubulin suppressor-like RCC1 family protein